MVHVLLKMLGLRQNEEEILTLYGFLHARLAFLANVISALSSLYRFKPLKLLKIVNYVP